MIVVEGPDGSGKTTLIKEIQAQFPVTIAPRVVSKDAQAMVDLVAWVEEDNKKLSQGVVYDRHRLISEPIYGPILRPSNLEPGFDDIGWLTNMLRLFYAKKPTIIYCLPPKHVVLGNIESLPRGATLRHASQIYDLYLTKASTDIGCGRAYHYDYTEGSGTLQGVIGTINRQEMF